MKDYVAVNMRAYDALAPEYLSRTGNSAEPLAKLVGTPLKYAKNNFPAIHAAEIGPGNGEVCRYLEANGCTTVAIDVAANILDNVKQISPSTKTVLADILTCDLGQEVYELIYCGALVHLFTLADTRIVMGKLYRALKPRGIMFMNTTIHPTPDEGYYEKVDYNIKLKRYRHRYTRPEFVGLIGQAGFKIIDSIETDESDRGKYWLAAICQK